MYLIGYILGHDDNCWNKFIGIFENLTGYEQIQVLSNVGAYFGELKNKNGIKQHNKVKAKSKDE